MSAANLPADLLFGVPMLVTGCQSPSHALYCLNSTMKNVVDGDGQKFRVDFMSPDGDAFWVHLTVAGVMVVEREIQISAKVRAVRQRLRINAGPGFVWGPREYNASFGSAMLDVYTRSPGAYKRYDRILFLKGDEGLMQPNWSIFSAYSGIDVFAKPDGE